MSHAEDLAPLLGPGPEPAMGMRQGVIRSWDQLTAENTVEVGGTTLTNVQILNTSEARLLTPGAVVSLLRSGASWFILGRVTVPGTPDAATALQMISNFIFAAEVSTFEQVTSTSYADLATAGPSVSGVLVSSGKALVFMSYGYQEFSDTTTVGASRGASMSFDVDGPTSISASDSDHLLVGHSDDGIVSGGFTSNNLRLNVAKVEIVTGLDPGLYTFTAKYRRSVAQGDIDIGSRKLVVFPF